MFIRELNTSNKMVTVTFDYDELRCIQNALYQLSKFDDVEKDRNFNNVRAKIIELFALVKHGMIPEFELSWMHKLLCNQQEYPPKKGGEDDGENT